MKDSYTYPSDITFRPMIRPSFITDATYEPYESLFAVRADVLRSGSNGTITDSVVLKQGRNYRVHGTISGVNLTANQYTTVAYIPAGYTPICPFLERRLLGSGVEGYLSISTSGQVSVYTETAKSNVTIYIEVTSML